ncbi:hypothetical protein SSABA_v1c01660 [Spiroplasma sabaudiense Ar-1343]|uniref:Transmembrane protein n=1 Tax=Spiroplasma sabaudiense Ar-1343 TaxID=1276257 RepID=W6A8U5_9MOLU|nr:hypothetical protein [Spiroplasma sabaudiense]AHI53578.1 hypothetical protein SSABA_v1c01660 [Spiroplasma sabaudiense Ar-1343]
MHINKKTYLYLIIPSILILLGINFACLLLLQKPLFIYMVFLATILLTVYLYKFGMKYFAYCEDDIWKLKPTKEFHKKLAELIGVIICGTLMLNFMTIYSFWVIVTDILPTPQAVIVVVILVWLFATILEYKLSAVLFILIFINPLLVNTFESSLLIIAAVIGTTHLTFSVKQSREFFTDNNNKIFNAKLRLLILALIIGCLLFGFFPFADKGIYIDYYDFSKTSQILNLLPLLIILIMVSFQLQWQWITLAIIVVQVTLGYSLGFAKQVSSQNYLNILFFNDEIFFDAETFKPIMMVLKVLLDVIYLLMLGFLLLGLSDLLNKNFQAFSSTPKPKTNPKYALATSSFWIILDQLFFFGEDYKESDYPFEISNGEVKDIIVNEGLVSLFKSINPFDFSNILLIICFSTTLDYSTPFTVLLLLKFNWITYLYVMLVFLVRITGKWSNFMLSTNWLNFSNMIPKRKEKNLINTEKS